MAIQSANAAEAALLAKKKAAREKAMDPRSWAQATPQQVAQMQADKGYSVSEYEEPSWWNKKVPDQIGVNLNNATGTDLLWWAGKGIDKAGDFLIKEPAKSFARTLSTKNIQTAINPKSTLTQRINAVGEDAINIASIIPSARTALSALEQAAMGRFLKRLPAVQAEQRAAWSAYDTAVKEAYEEAAKLPPQQLIGIGGKPGPRAPQTPPRDIQTKLNQLKPDFPRPPAAKPSRYELARQKADELRWGVARDLGAQFEAQAPDIPPVAGPDIYRGWHTNYDGRPLPSELNPWEDYIGVEAAAERRGGSPQGNMLSSGLYQTDARPTSGSYAIYKQIREAMGYKPTGSYLPMERTYAQYGLDDFVNLNTPISQIDEFKGLMQNTVSNPYGLHSNHPFFARERTRLSSYPSVPGSSSRVISAEDLDVSKWNFGGKNPEEITILDLLNAAPNEDTARAVIMSLKKPVAATGTTRLRYPLFRNPGDIPSKVAYGSEDMPSMLIESGGPIMYRIGDNEFNTFSATPRPYRSAQDRGFGTTLFPDNAPFSGEITAKGYPGQNYFDLPMKRNPLTGSIEEVGGMKALDVERISLEQRNEIADATKNWLESLGINEQRIENEDLRDVLVDLLDRIQRPNQDPRFNFVGFRQSQDDIAYLVHELTGSRFGKDQWYKMLKDDLGYEAIPHGGGMVAGGSATPTHQAIVFNAPEKLPPSTYVPEVFPRNSNEITAERMNEYLKQLATARMLQPGKRMTRDFSGRMNKQLLNAAKFASASPIGTYAQNLAGNR
jgi:hypothetical protein